MARQAKRPGNPTGKRPRPTKRQREQIARRIRSIRTGANPNGVKMTQADFGLAVGVGQASRKSAERTVQAWENRMVVPRRETLVQIARIGDKSVHWLETGEDLPDVEPGEDLESRLRSVEGRLDTAVTERRGEDARPMTIAALVASLRGEDEGVTLTALREAVAALAEQTGAIAVELAKLREERESQLQSETRAPGQRDDQSKAN